MNARLASQSASGTDGARREQLLEIVHMLSTALAEVHPTLRPHALRVANNSANFCERFKLLNRARNDNLYLAAMVHDLGLIALGPELVAAAAGGDPPPLEVRRHPVVGEKILSQHSPFADLLPIVRHHRERFDGQGFPDGLSGTGIPLEARVLAIFHFLDELVHPPAGQPAPTVEQALQQITERGGQDFDPDLLPQLAEFLKDGALDAEDFILKTERQALRRQFTEILQKFSAGKIPAPVIPKVVQDLQAEIKRTSSNTERVAAVIERDPTISLRLISIANSPVYRGLQEITSVRAALPRLGLKETLNIVFGIANKGLYKPDKAQFKILMDQMWVHSLATAVGAKLLAQKIGLADPDQLFLMGLVHDIGKPILVRGFAEGAAAKSYNFEAVAASVDEAHLSVGAMLVKRWGFAQPVINTVMHHEGGDYTPDTAREILVVHLANLLTRGLGLSLKPPDETPPWQSGAAGLLKLEQADLEAIGAEVERVVAEVGHLF